jgi:hypothetical protein
MFMRVGREIYAYPAWLLILITIISMAENKKLKKIHTPSGDITYKVLADDEGGLKDKIAELSEKELVTLKLDLERASAFISALVPPNQRNGDTLEDLDLAFAAWLKASSQTQFTENDVIKIVGSALGFYCIEHLGFHWVRVTDSYGTSIALIKEKPETRSYPFTSIQYRIEDKKTNFIVGLFRVLEHEIKINSEDE